MAATSVHSVDGSLWWDSFSDLLLLLDSMRMEEVTLPHGETDVAAQVRASLPWLLHSTARFLPPTPAAAEALNSPSVSIGGHVLEVTAPLRTLSLQASAALHLHEIQTFILVSRLTSDLGSVTCTQVGDAYAEERVSLLRCTRALVGLLPDGPATLGELCSSLEDGLLLATTLDLLPGGAGEEVWLHLDVLFLLLYHNPCSPATFERLLDCFHTHLLPPTSLTALRLSAQVGGDKLTGLRQKALLLLLEALDLDSLLLHLTHPNSAPPHPFQETHLLTLDSKVCRVVGPESAPLLLAWSALACLSSSSIPHATHVQAAVEGGGLSYLLSLQSSPLFLDGSEGSAPVEGYHSVLKSLCSALLAAYQDGPTDSILSLLCSSYRGAPSLCLQLWDRSSSTDHPVRQLLLTTPLPSPPLLCLLAALAQGEWPASCVHHFLHHRGMMMPLLTTLNSVCNGEGGGEEEWEMAEGVVEVVDGMVGGNAALVPLLLGMEGDLLSSMVSVLSCPRLMAVHPACLRVLAAFASPSSHRVAQLALGLLLPALHRGSVGVVEGVLDVCTALLTHNVRSSPLLRVVSYCHLTLLPSYSTWHYRHPNGQWRLGSKLYSMLCAAATEGGEEVEGGVWTTFRASLSLPPSFPLLLSDGVHALQAGQSCDHLEAVLESALSLLTTLLYRGREGLGGVAQAVLPLTAFRTCVGVAECALRALCAAMAGQHWTLADAQAEYTLGKVVGEALSPSTATLHPSLFSSAVDLITTAAHHRPLLLQALLGPTSPILTALRTHVATVEGWGSQSLCLSLTLLLLLWNRVPHLLSPHFWSWSILCAPLRLPHRGGEESEGGVQCECLLLRVLLAVAFWQQQGGEVEGEGVVAMVGGWSGDDMASRIDACARRAQAWAALLGFCAGKLGESVLFPCLPPVARAVGKAGGGEGMGSLARSLLLLVRPTVGGVGEEVVEGCMLGLRHCVQEEGEEWRSAQHSLMGLLLVVLSGRKGCQGLPSLLPSLCQRGEHLLLLLPILNAALTHHLPHPQWVSIVVNHLSLPPLLAQLRQGEWQGTQTDSFLTLARSLAATHSGTAFLHAHFLLSLLPHMAHTGGGSVGAFCLSWDAPSVEGVARWGKCMGVAAAMGGGEEERVMDFIGSQKERMLTALHSPPPPAPSSSRHLYTSLPHLTALRAIGVMLAAGAAGRERRTSHFSSQTAHLLAFLSNPCTLSCLPQTLEEKRAAQQAPPSAVVSGWFGVTTRGSGGSSSLYSHQVGMEVYRVTLSLLHFHALLSVQALPRGMEREYALPDLPTPQVLHGLQDQALEAMAEMGAGEVREGVKVLLGVVERAVFLESCLGTAYGMRPSLARQEAFAKALNKLPSSLDSLYPQEMDQIRETARVVYKGV